MPLYDKLRSIVKPILNLVIKDSFYVFQIHIQIA